MAKAIDALHYNWSSARDPTVLNSFQLPQHSSTKTAIKYEIIQLLF